MDQVPVYEQVVAWGEMDALGHVNNAVYFRYMESARVAFLLWAGIDRLKMGPGGMDGVGGVGVILQSAQCRFRRPVVYPDTLLISSKVEAVASDRFTLAHDLTSKATGEVVALGSGVIVAYDYAKGVKAELPAAWAERLSRCVG